MEASTLDLALAVLGALLALPLAAVVLAAGPRRRTNHLLALVLALPGIATVTWSWSSTAPDALQPVLLAFNGLTTPLILASYVFLLVETLDTPLTRPLRSNVARAVVSGILTLPIIPFIPVAVRVVRAGPPYAAQEAYDAILPSMGLTLVVLAWAFAASVSAWLRAPRGSPTRTRAFHFVLAFAARDACIAAALTVGILGIPGPWGLLWPLALVVSVPILAYGILRTQVLDIDLRIKAGVRHGTVLTAFLLVFGVLAIVVERATTQAVGLAAGGVGVALLLAAIVPLQRFAARVAERLLPNVREDEEYLARRRLEVYRTALEDALAHSPNVSDDPLLQNLRRALGVSREQHVALLVALRPRAPLGGEVPAPFELVGELGRGGFGRALLARDRHLDRYVVLKQPLGLVAAGNASHDMFLREARLAAQIQHPNVVAVHQILPDRDPPILVLEHVDGESLADRLAREGPLAPAEVARLALDVLAGLERIHAAGIVHRDLKPGNILLTRDGIAKITDFGVAHDLSGTLAQSLTMTGFQPGSPAYMSPEQTRGRPIDARSDLYSLAVVLHEALTGRLPAPPNATLAARAVPVMLAPPPALAPVLSRALEADPARRYASAREMAEALRKAIAVRG